MITTRRQVVQTPEQLRAIFQKIATRFGAGAPAMIYAKGMPPAPVQGPYCGIAKNPSVPIVLKNTPP